MNSVHQLKDSFQYAMHGCGAYKGLRQTNTKEAILHWYGKGVRVMEIDMASTSDGDYVAVAHHLDKKDLRRLEIFNLPESRTKDWFMSQKLFSISTSGLTPLSLKSIVDLMKEKEDLIVMFDLFGLFSEQESKQFVEKLNAYIDDLCIWDRCLLETYNTSMIEGIDAARKDTNIIACVRYEDNINEKEAISPECLLSNGVKFVSYPWYIKALHPEEIMQYSKAGITVFSRTKSNRQSHQLIKEGVSVNIVANRFDHFLMPIQWALYMTTYVKRIYIKLLIKLNYK